MINGAIVSDLDMMYIESVLQEELSLCLMLRSSRTEPPALAAALAAADAAIAQLVCPPPPSEPLVLTDDVLSHLIVPAPHESMCFSSLMQRTNLYANLCTCLCKINGNFYGV